MRAIVVHKPGDLRIDEVPKPTVSADDVLIRVRAVAVCGTDFHILKGHRVVPLPKILGHEMAGDIVEVGESVTARKVGEKVTVEPNYSCGKCRLCRTGKYNICRAKRTMSLNIDGCFSEYVVAPAEYVWPLPEDMPYERGALVEPTTIAYHAVQRAQPRVGDVVLVLGAGPIGLLVLQLAKLQGAKVIVADQFKNRLDLASRFGADHVIDFARTPTPDATKALTDGTGADIVIDATGSPHGFQAALDSVAPGGRIAIVGLPSEPASVNVMALARNEVTVVGCVTCVFDFPTAVDLLNRRKVDVSPFEAERYRFDDVHLAFENIEKKTAVKPVLIL
ncbi:MAG: zinc-dependent alcohol dehydrogenase [Betaproteobacteria bacterium]